MGKRFQLSLKRLHVFFLQSYFGDRGRRLWNLSSLTLGADVRRSRARPALRSACGDGPGLPVSLGPLTPTPGAAGVEQHSAAEAAGPETCVRVPGLECGGERPPKGGAPRHRVVQSRKRWAVAGARPRSPSEAGRGVV